MGDGFIFSTIFECTLCANKALLMLMNVTLNVNESSKNGLNTKYVNLKHIKNAQ